MSLIRFDIQTALSPSQLVKQLQLITRTPPSFREAFKNSFIPRKESDPEFLGKVDQCMFKLRRDIRYRNSFLPQIRGTITGASTGSTVSVVMLPHPLVIAFMILWFAGVGFGLFAGVSGWPKSGLISIIIPCAMLVFGLALTIGAFVPEARKAKRLLTSVLHAEDNKA